MSKNLSSKSSAFSVLKGTAAPFCETDLPIQQLVQEIQLAADVMQTDLYQDIVLAFESLVDLPVHTFGLVSVAI